MPGTIVIVSHFGWGVHRYRLPFLLALQRAGWTVIAIADWSDGDYEAQVRAAGIATRAIPVTRRWIDPVSDLRTILQLVRHHRELKPDVVQHFHTRPMLLGGIAARIARVPRIVHCITGLGSLFSGKWEALRRIVRPVYRLTFGGGALAVFQNEHDRQVLVAQKIVAADRAFLVPGSGVDTEALKPDPAIPPQARDVVIMACRLLRSKGVVEFVQAAQALKARFPAFRFILAGGPSGDYGTAGPEDVDLDWLRAQDAVTWTGHLDPAALEQLFRQAAIAVLPSYYPEGLPRGLIEAAAAGAPIVTTDMPGCRDAIIPGKTGLLCEPRSVLSLSTAMETILKNPQQVAEMSAAARDFAVEQFDINAIAARFMAVYAR